MVYCLPEATPEPGDLSNEITWNMDIATQIQEACKLRVGRLAYTWFIYGTQHNHSNVVVGDGQNQGENEKIDLTW